jgi:hypothetical protein
MGDLAAADQLRHRKMAAIGLGRAEQLFQAGSQVSRRTLARTGSLRD